ncbi:MAG: hypothetical protein ABW250_03850 [Pyrinomonadaceae bacterium]
MQSKRFGVLSRAAVRVAALALAALAAGCLSQSTPTPLRDDAANARPETSAASASPVQTSPPATAAPAARGFRQRLRGRHR